MPSGYPGSAKTYSCKNCGTICKFRYGKKMTNVYCSHSCQMEYQWKHVTKPKIERGECTHESSKTFKKYLIEKFGEVCSECEQGNIWNNKPLSLQVDHIDGDSDNNFPSNLRLICPNCHTQTPTFGSKGVGNRYKKISKRNTYLQSYKTVL